MNQLSSTFGMIFSLETPLKDETWSLMEMTLHLNESIRGRLAISEEDLVKGLDLLHDLKEIKIVLIVWFIQRVMSFHRGTILLDIKRNYISLDQFFTS